MLAAGVRIAGRVCSTTPLRILARASPSPLPSLPLTLVVLVLLAMEGAAGPLGLHLTASRLRLVRLHLGHVLLLLLGQLHSLRTGGVVLVVSD
jgi:hypothetical protein